jgi:methyl-accepting chemotaxis protein
VAAVWGEAEIEVHVDGTSLPGEVRNAARVAAIAGGQAFEPAFKKAMSKALRNSVKDFAKSLGDMMQTLVLSSGAVRGLYRQTLRLREGFKNLGGQIKNFTTSTLSKVRRGFGEVFGDIRDDHIKTMAELRESFKAMKPTIDDWAASFPKTTKFIQDTGGAIRKFRTDMATMGREMRDEQIVVMRDLRESFRAMKPSLEDLQQTFPGVTRALRNTRNGFVRVKDAAVDFGGRIKALGPDMDDVRDSAGRMDTAWSRLTRTFMVGREAMAGTREGIANYISLMKSAGDATDDTADSADRANDAIGRRTQRASRRGVGGIRSLIGSWKGLPHGLRQAVFWITLTISALGTLSVLTSALSGTLVTLVTMLTAAGAAAGIATAGFFGLFGEGEVLTEGAQRAKDAFIELGSAFHGLQTGIVTAMFENMAPSIQAITAALPQVSENLNAFAGTVGESISRIFTALSSDAGVSTFNALLAGFSPILDSLTTAAIGFGDAFGDILVESLPTAQKFAEAIANVATQFSTWTSSEEGRARIKQFFETAERIMPPVVDLVVAIANALAGLVTPATIAGTEQFLASLTNFVPVLGQIVGVIANLNVFGVIAAALDTLGAALAPIIPPLMEMATIISEQLIAGLETLTPAFAEVGESLAPLITNLAPLVEALLPTLFTIIAGGVEVIAGIIEVLSAFVEALIGTSEETTLFGEILFNVLAFLGDAFEVWNALVTGGLKIIADLIRGDASAAWQDFENVVKTVVEKLGGNWDQIKIGMDILKQKIKDVLSGIEGFFRNFGQTIIDVFDNIGGAIQDAIGWFNDLFGAASSASSAARGAASSGGGGGRGAIPQAMGGIHFGPTHVLMGEAGPEAIVPLRRPLSAVDPSVRALSAFAQGIGTPRMAAGGVVTGGKSISIAEGAIQVNGSIDPRRTAIEVVNRIVERAVA